MYMIFKNVVLPCTTKASLMLLLKGIVRWDGPS